MPGLRGEREVSQRRLLLEDEDGEPLGVKPGWEVGDVLRLLEGTAVLMHYKTLRGMKWYARAKNGSTFAEADSAVEAMQQALKKTT